MRLWTHFQLNFCTHFLIFFSSSVFCSCIILAAMISDHPLKGIILKTNYQCCCPKALEYIAWPPYLTSQNISSTSVGDNVDIKYTSTTTTDGEIHKIYLFTFLLPPPGRWLRLSVEPTLDCACSLKATLMHSICKQFYYSKL